MPPEDSINLLSEFIELSEFLIGTLYGAVLSALVFWWIQTRAFKKEEMIWKRESEQARKALGKSLYIKLSKIHSKAIENN